MPHSAESSQERFTEQLRKGIELLNSIEPPEVGGTPRELLLEEDKFKLYRYTSQTPGIPVLIVYSLVNRPYIADLQPDRSFIRKLQASGLEVYLVDWGYPEESDRFTDLDDYLNDYLDLAVEAVSRETGEDKINLAGICQGGTLALCYAALHPEKIGSLALMVAPVDFHTEDNLLTPWLKNIDAETIVRNNGNFPGEALVFLFRSLRPFQLNRKKFVDLIESLDQRDKVENFLRMERWIADCPDLAGQAFIEFNRKFFVENSLMENSLEIGGEKVDLTRIGCPVLNIFARQDHLVPPASSKALADLIPKKRYSELEIDSGHIGLFVSSKSLKTVPAKIASWLQRKR